MARHLWLSYVVDVQLFLMGETDVYSRCFCADGSTKPVPSVPEHQGRKTELSIHSGSEQCADERLSSPGRDMPGATELCFFLPRHKPTADQHTQCSEPTLVSFIMCTGEKVYIHSYLHVKRSLQVTLAQIFSICSALLVSK